MVTAGVSQIRGYTMDGGYNEANQKEDNCFATKPVSEQINDCDQLINKVHSILGSLKIPVTDYEKDLNELKFKSSNLS